MKLFDKTMKMFSLLCILMMIGIISCDDNGFVRLVVRVGEDVVLPCSLGPEVDIGSALFDWMKDGQEVFLYDDGFYHSGDKQFRGRVSHFPDKLKNGDASIIIRNSQVSDSGNYSCYFQRHQHKTFYVELVVGIFAKPRVMILEITERWALLQCEVRGAFPKPQILWIDSDGTVLPAEEKLEDSDGLHYPSTLMLQTTVTKTGIFSCQVAQKELNLITETQISVPRTCDETVTGSDGVLLGVAIGSSTVVLLGLVAVRTYCWCRRRAMIERLNAINSTMDKRPAVEMLKDFISPKNEQFTRVSASHSDKPTTQNLRPPLEEELSRLFLPQPVDNQDCLDHSPLLNHPSGDQPGPPVSSSPSAPLPARKSPDSDDSSHDPERPNAINSPKDKRLAVERRDSGVSSLHSSHHPAREQNQEAESEEDVNIPPQEF